MALKRIRALISGRVQGVFFRACTRDEGERLALRGWVRNLPDGRVETEFEGEEKAAQHMLQWLKKGSPASQVESVDWEELSPGGTEKGFEIRY